MQGTLKFGYRFLGILWFIYIAIFFAGGITQHIFRVVAAGSVLFGTFILINKQSSWFYAVLERTLQTYLARKSVRWLIVLLGFFIFGSVTLGLVLDYEALNGTLWDLAQYIAGVESFVRTSKPEYHFPGDVANYFNVHSSLSIYILKYIYIFKNSAWILLIWQGVHLCVPAIVFSVAARGFYTTSAQNTTSAWPTTPFIFASLGFIAWVSSPVFLGQRFWPYIFHIGGVTLLSLAYYCYAERRYVFWAITLLLLPIEKEDFGVISFAFALVGLVDAIFSRPIKSRTLLLGLLSVVIMAFSAYYVSTYGGNITNSDAFSARFGAIASNPKDFIWRCLREPQLVMRLLWRPEALYYWSFFIVATGLWSHRRCLNWHTWKFFIPVAPVLFFNSVAAIGPMQLFKDHYALPIAVGTVATLVFGTWKVWIKHYKPSQAIVFMFSTAVLPMLWTHQSPFRNLKEAALLYQQRTTERAIIQAVQKKNKTKPKLFICCEERLCTNLMDYAQDRLMTANRCVEGSKILTKYQAMKPVFIIHTENNIYNTLKPNLELPHFALPTSWSLETPLIRVSSME